MRAVIQRVLRAEVSIEDKVVGEIGPGLLVFLGIEEGDSRADADYICSKTIGLRVFDDAEGVPNLSVEEIGGSVLIVSQFTLCGDCKKGTRPSFDKSAPPVIANELYEYFISLVKTQNINCSTGVFGAMMDVELINDGPVTFMVEK